MLQTRCKCGRRFHKPCMEGNRLCLLCRAMKQKRTCTMAKPPPQIAPKPPTAIGPMDRSGPASTANRCYSVKTSHSSAVPPTEGQAKLVTGDMLQPTPIETTPQSGSSAVPPPEGQAKLVTSDMLQPTPIETTPQSGSSAVPPTEGQAKLVTGDMLQPTPIETTPQSGSSAVPPPEGQAKLVTSDMLQPTPIETTPQSGSSAVPPTEGQAKLVTSDMLQPNAIETTPQSGSSAVPSSSGDFPLNETCKGRFHKLNPKRCLRCRADKKKKLMLATCPTPTMCPTTHGTETPVSDQPESGHVPFVPTSKTHTTQMSVTMEDTATPQEPGI